MTEAADAGGLGNQAPEEVVVEETPEVAKARMDELRNGARRAMYDESERERLLQQSQEGEVIITRE